jgi:8-oxo-dGTP diphosphatase
MSDGYCYYCKHQNKGVCRATYSAETEVTPFTRCANFDCDEPPIETWDSTKNKKPKLAADIVVLNDKGEILLVERKWKPHGWALPGGHVEYGESVAQAASRELREETGLIVDPTDLTLLGEWSNPNRDPRGHVISLAYLAKSYTGELKAADDAKNVKFFKAEVLKLKDIFAFPDHANIIGAGLMRAWSLGVGYSV